MNFNHLCVIGLGYIGLPTASTFANIGLDVIGVDINSNVVKSLNNGQLHIFEPGLGNLLQDSIQSGKIRFQEKPAPADAFIIAVPTPFFGVKQADMRAVVSATESIVPYLKKGNLVILESTSPPCTTTKLVAPILERSGLKAGEDFYLAYSPERVLPGQILVELVENARVIGGINQPSAEAGRDLYARFVKGEIILTNSTTAEMVKLMENTYRDVNIAIANEFSRLADRFEIDIWEAIEIANRHPRVKILQPGPGVGGHCISVDPWFLVEAAPDITPLIHTARNVNDNQPDFVVNLVKRAAVNDLRGKNVTLLGLTYKPDVDDARESPALRVIELLKHAGANVVCYDPFKVGGEVEGMPVADTLSTSLKAADYIVVLVAHTELKKLDPRSVASMTQSRVIIDAVNIWKDRLWGETGFKVYHLGSRAA